MAKKPRMGLFAGIKYDWQQWVADKNIVKKIFWFIWLVIWTVTKVLFGALWQWTKISTRYHSKVEAEGKFCKNCRFFDGSICVTDGHRHGPDSTCSKFARYSR